MPRTESLHPDRLRDALAAIKPITAANNLDHRAAEAEAMSEAIRAFGVVLLDELRTLIAMARETGCDADDYFIRGLDEQISDSLIGPLSDHAASLRASHADTREDEQREIVE